jgi:hypothetical protein
MKPEHRDPEFKRIYGPVTLEKLTQKDLHIKNVGGNNLGYKCTYLVPIKILGRKEMHDLVVLENVNVKILGIDFILKNA